MIPIILIKMKESLKKHNAFTKEGIFRISGIHFYYYWIKIKLGDFNIIKQIRKQMDKNNFTDHPDVYSVAQLLKVIF